MLIQILHGRQASKGRKKGTRSSLAECLDTAHGQRRGKGGQDVLGVTKGDIEGDVHLCFNGLMKRPVKSRGVGAG